MRIDLWSKPDIGGWIGFYRANLKRFSFDCERYDWGEPRLSRVWWAVLGFTGDIHIFYRNHSDTNQSRDKTEQK